MSAFGRVGRACSVYAMAAFLVAVLVGAPPSAGAEAPSDDVSWVSTGDSFSSGEGIDGNQGACAQSPLAYGPLAARLARDAGWAINQEAFTACTGHLIEDLFNQRPGVGRRSLWEWGTVEQGTPERVDLITFSFGKNDIGFGDLLRDCLPVATSFRQAVTDGVVNVTGCHTPEEEIAARIDALVDPPRRDCVGGRHGSRRSGDPAYDCNLLISDANTATPTDDIRGSLVDFYVYLAQRHLTDRGHLVVVGYPQMFAPVQEWPGWVKIECRGILRGDAERINRLGSLLDGAQIRAVRQANNRLGEERVQWLPRSIIYRDGGHELCGRGEDWLNGPDVDIDGDGVRFQGSYHPNAPGHEATARQLLVLLDTLLATVVANGDGIAGVRLFEPAGDLLDHLVEDLGPPDGDTGWQEIACLPGDPARERVLRWGALSVTVTDDPAQFPYPFLSAWLLNAADGDQPEALAVEPAVALGDRYEEVAAQGAVWDEFYGSWELANLFGETSSSAPDPDATVTAFGAGGTGLFGC